MLSPKRTKFRKQQRGRMKGKATRGNTIAFGDFALQAAEPVWLTSRQIEATRRTITRYVRRTGKLWIRVFPDKPVTSASNPRPDKIVEARASAEWDSISASL